MTPDQKQNIDDRIDAGLRFLRANYPNWFKTVVLKEFDFTNPCRCIIGFICRTEQKSSGSDAFNEFHKRHDKKDSYTKPYDLGFDWGTAAGCPSIEQQTYMQERWVKEIKTARANARRRK